MDDCKKSLKDSTSSKKSFYISHILRDDNNEEKKVKSEPPSLSNSIISQVEEGRDIISYPVPSWYRWCNSRSSWIQQLNHTSKFIYYNYMYIYFLLVNHLIYFILFFERFI